MPTGTKIAAIVLVVLLGAAGLYYAFVPPAPAPKFDPSKGSGSNVTDPLGRPSTLPPAGSSTSTGTAAGIDALANRAGVGTAGTAPSGAAAGANGTAPAGAVAGTNTVPGTPTSGATTSGATTPAATTPGTSNTAAPRTAFNNGFRNGPGTAASPGVNGGTAGTGAIAGTNPTDSGGLANGGTGGSNATGATVGAAGASGGSSAGLAGAGPTNPSTSSTGNSTANSTVNGTGSETTYVVKKGDSFESISKSMYGTTTKWKEIAKANPTVDPTRMKIGAKLRIPAAGASISTETSMASASSGSSAASSGKSSTKTAAGSTSGGTHVIAKGDTFSSLARSYYGDSKFWKAIAKANPKISEKSLAIGTKIAIPPKSTVVSGGNVER